MSGRKVRSFLLRIALPVVLVGFCVQWVQVTHSAESNSDSVTAAAAWNPSAAAFEQVRRSCTNLSFPELGECFARNMRGAGASTEAVAFTRSIGNEGYLHVFVPTGRVDMAFTTYPFRANTNEACLLVNGDPPHVDVDNMPDLPQATMKHSRAFQKLAATYPKVSLWPGDRGDRRSVVPGSTPEGGQRFIAEYKLLNGCHACAQVGTARFAFDFDASGKLTGVEFISVKTE
ncbi:MAG TPA: hypothetical protein VN633_10005 [Bryobacteraceae bacterium]|nr:hypothetical protein [Bryobacteraceae bacterium]